MKIYLAPEIIVQNKNIHSIIGWRQLSNSLIFNCLMKTTLLFTWHLGQGERRIRGLRLSPKTLTHKKAKKPKKNTREKTDEREIGVASVTHFPSLSLSLSLSILHMFYKYKFIYFLFFRTWNLVCKLSCQHGKWRIIESIKNNFGGTLRVSVVIDYIEHTKTT